LLALANVPPPDLDATTVDAVRALARVARLLERSTGELSLAQYRVLAAVASGQERASRIAQRLALGKPAVSAAVDALTQRGLLTRSDVAGDQRAAALALTPAGESALATIEATMTERLGHLVARRPDPHRVLSALAELGIAIEELMVERSATRTVTRGPGRWWTVDRTS
jgi:DNA-binding MarR family transcriptional regulator